MLRSEAEIKTELNKCKVRRDEYRKLNRQPGAKAMRHDIEAAYAAIIVNTLSYVLGETVDPSIRVK